MTEPVARMMCLASMGVDADGHGAVAGQARLALDDLDAVLLHQARHAAGQRRDHLLAALHHRAVVHLGLADLDAELAGFTHLAEHVGDPQHGLGRDAGVVQAASADGVLLHHRGLHAELRGADRGDVPAGTRADDDRVKRGGSHGAPESRRHPTAAPRAGW